MNLPSIARCETLPLSGELGVVLVTRCYDTWGLADRKSQLSNEFYELTADLTLIVDASRGKYLIESRYGPEWVANLIATESRVLLGGLDRDLAEMLGRGIWISGTWMPIDPSEVRLGEPLATTSYTASEGGSAQ